MKELSVLSAFGIPAAALAASAVLAWGPAAQADGLAFGSEGGQVYRYEDDSGRAYRNYGGYYQGYQHRRHHYVEPDNRVLGRRDEPSWRPRHTLTGDRLYQWPGPRCIQRYNRQYCR